MAKPREDSDLRWIGDQVVEACRRVSVAGKFADASALVHLHLDGKLFVMAVREVAATPGGMDA